MIRKRGGTRFFLVGEIHDGATIIIRLNGKRFTAAMMISCLVIRLNGKKIYGCYDDILSCGRDVLAVFDMPAWCVAAPMFKKKSFNYCTLF